jgi:hypothetical protein
MHVYAIETPAGAVIRDQGEPATTDVSSFLEPGDQVLGFAYDPYTDHFFLRLDPGNRVRVVDRPARAIKREFSVAGLPEGGGDLAIRPRDGHVFFLLSGKPDVLESTRLGKEARRFTLAGISGAIAIAYNATDDSFFVLQPDGMKISQHDTSGRLLSGLTLERAATNSLG